MASAITDLYASAAAMADLEKLSVHSLAWAGRVAAVFNSLSVFDLAFVHTQGWGNIFYFPNCLAFLQLVLIHLLVCQNCHWTHSE